ncbi:MAG: N-acetyl-gamma-glutamyl-phosphate reductase [Verrucomicrobiales bacterium]
MAYVHRVSVIGATGYTGEELLFLLLQHPSIEVVGVHARSGVGSPLSNLIPRLAGRPRAERLVLKGSSMAEILDCKPDLVFLALPHGTAAEFAKPLLAEGLTVIDLSADFRLNSASAYNDFFEESHPASELLADAVYGLPELHRTKIRQAKLVASPGCYPTSIILPLVPLLREKLVELDTITTVSLSGVSGAGRKVDASLLYGEVNESARAYGLPKHRHLAEIEQELSEQAQEEVHVSFTPILAPMNRGILTTTYGKLAAGCSFEQVSKAIHSFYNEEPFLRLLGQTPAQTNRVVGSNFLDLSWFYDQRSNRIILISAEDNLIKGAGGQAIQSMNLIFGLAETTGLL